MTEIQSLRIKIALLEKAFMDPSIKNSLAFVEKIMKDYMPIIEEILKNETTK